MAEIKIGTMTEKDFDQDYEVGRPTDSAYSSEYLHKREKLANRVKAQVKDTRSDNVVLALEKVNAPTDD